MEMCKIVGTRISQLFGNDPYIEKNFRFIEMKKFKCILKSQ